MSTCAASIDEVVVPFECGDEQLLGVLTRSRDAAAAGPPGVGALIIVGGPQYRVGSHRQFVFWARSFARSGVPAMRFDVRGMGDGSGDMRPFTALSEDIAAAIGAFSRASPGLERVALCGLCDGASAALLYLDETADPRVAGLILLNPWVRSQQTMARTYVKHYYLQRLFSKAFLIKLLSGKVAVAGLADLARHLRQALRRDPVAARDRHNRPYPERMADALSAFDGPTLLALSGNDYTAKEFAEHCTRDAKWAGALGKKGLRQLDLPTADHTFSASTDRLQLERASAAWLMEQGWGRQLAGQAGDKP